MIGKTMFAWTEWLQINKSKEANLKNHHQNKMNS